MKRCPFLSVISSTLSYVIDIFSKVIILVHMFYIAFGWGYELQLQFFLLIAYLKHLQHKLKLEVYFETTCILKYLDTFRVINFSNTLRVSMCGG